MTTVDISIGQPFCRAHVTDRPTDQATGTRRKILAQKVEAKDNVRKPRYNGLNLCLMVKASIWASRPRSKFYLCKLLLILNSINVHVAYTRYHRLK